MRPVDPRLLKHAQASRPYILLTAGLGLLTAGLVTAQALLLATVIAGVAMDGQTLAQVRTPLVWLSGVVLARAGVAAIQERFAHRAAGTVIGQLRARLVERVARSAGDGDVTGQIRADGPAGPAGPAGPSGDPAALATLATRGLDALEAYLTRYLPQLLLAATVTPAVLAVVWWHDLVSGLTIAVTLPLIPLFMALVGLSTAALAKRRLASMQRLGAQVLDLIAGLPTLRALGRERGQAVRVRQTGDAYRKATMGTLRSAFLSALVLESLTTLSVALVAVGIGLRLVYGHLDLRTGLAVLILAPEVYLPLRMVGVHYHASVDGLAAAEQAFAVLEAPRPERSARPPQELTGALVAVRARGLGVRHPGRGRVTPSGLDLEVRRGEVVALVGPSGVGKSTAVQVLLGLRRPDAGRVELLTATAAVDLADVDPAAWQARVAWVPQHPVLVPGTLRDNLLLTAPSPQTVSPEQVARAAQDSGLAAVVAGLPQGWLTPVGHGGVGLSAGQRQRLALARALLREAELVVLDEPTAHLDPQTEQQIHAGVERLRQRGTAVLLVAHRPALVALADRVVTVTDAAAEPPSDTDTGLAATARDALTGAPA